MALERNYLSYDPHRPISINLGFQGQPALYIFLNKLRLRETRQHFAHDIFKSNFCNYNHCIPNEISLKFAPYGQIDIGSDNGLRQPGGKPSSEPMMA